MEDTGDLQEAIEGLYETFSIYPLPEYTDPCLHCHTLDDEAVLHSAPLRQLSAVQLEVYANDALLVWGDVNGFKHFLPRMFDLYFSVSEPRFEFLDTEILFSKFRHARWLTWPIQEQTVVRELLHALWQEVLGDPPHSSSFTDLQSWLCSIAQAEDDLAPYLNSWINDQRSSAAFALSSFLLSDAGRNPFWDGREAQYDQLQDWRKSSGVSAKLEQAIVVAGSASDKAEFEAALGSLGFAVNE